MEERLAGMQRLRAAPLALPRGETPEAALPEPVEGNAAAVAEACS